MLVHPGRINGFHPEIMQPAGHHPDAITNPRVVNCDDVLEHPKPLDAPLLACSMRILVELRMVLHIFWPSVSWPPPGFLKGCSMMTQKQTAQYKMLFDKFRKYKGTLTGVMFWNVSNRSSGLDNFPVPGRKDYPLLFDQNLNPKEAYKQVVNF